MQNFNNCKVCGEKLKNVHHQRITAKMCADCRGYGVGGNSEIRQIHVDLKKKGIQPAEDEMFFEDDPRAEKDDQYGRVVKKATVISYGVSPLSDIMTKSNHHFFKRGKEGEANG